MLKCLDLMLDRFFGVTSTESSSLAKKYAGTSSDSGDSQSQSQGTDDGESQEDTTQAGNGEEDDEEEEEAEKTPAYEQTLGKFQYDSSVEPISRSTSGRDANTKEGDEVRPSSSTASSLISGTRRPISRDAPDLRSQLRPHRQDAPPVRRPNQEQQLRHIRSTTIGQRLRQLLAERASSREAATSGSGDDRTSTVRRGWVEERFGCGMGQVFPQPRGAEKLEDRTSASSSVAALEHGSATEGYPTSPSGAGKRKRDDEETIQPIADSSGEGARRDTSVWVWVDGDWKPQEEVGTLGSAGGVVRVKTEGTDEGDTDRKKLKRSSSGPPFYGGQSMSVHHNPISSLRSGSTMESSSSEDAPEKEREPEVVQISDTQPIGIDSAAVVLEDVYIKEEKTEPEEAEEAEIQQFVEASPCCGTELHGNRAGELISSSALTHPLLSDVGRTPMQPGLLEIFRVGLEIQACRNCANVSNAGTTIRCPDRPDTGSIFFCCRRDSVRHHQGVDQADGGDRAGGQEVHRRARERISLRSRPARRGRAGWPRAVAAPGARPRRARQERRLTGGDGAVQSDTPRVRAARDVQDPTRVLEVPLHPREGYRPYVCLLCLVHLV